MWLSSTARRCRCLGGSGSTGSTSTIQATLLATGTRASGTGPYGSRPGKSTTGTQPSSCGRRSTTTWPATPSGRTTWRGGARGDPGQRDLADPLGEARPQEALRLQRGGEEGLPQGVRAQGAVPTKVMVYCWLLPPSFC